MHSLAVALLFISRVAFFSEESRLYVYNLFTIQAAFVLTFEDRQSLFF